jgi:hypothetical protein
LHSGALRALTDIVTRCSTAKSGITFVGAVTGNGDTGVALTNGVFGTGNRLAALIRAGTGDRGAGGALTDIM